MSEPSTLARHKRSRSGHRASVTKTIAKTEEELSGNPDGPNPQKLKLYKQGLQQKLRILESLNEDILQQVEEEELEDEIDQMDAIAEKIGLCLLAIEEALEPKKLRDSAAIEPATVPTITAIEPTATSATDTTVSTESGDRARLGTRPADETSTVRSLTSAARTHTSTSTSAAPPADRVSISSAHPAPRVKLPKLSISKFNGDVTAWIPFWSQFHSSIHSNPHLND